MRTRRAWVSIGVAVWGALSVAVVVISWPATPRPFEYVGGEVRELRCVVNGTEVVERVIVNFNPYAQVIHELADELEPADELAGGGSRRDQDFCALREATQLPPSIIVHHLLELRDAVRQPGFAAEAFLEEALKRDAVSGDAVRQPGFATEVVLEEALKRDAAREVAAQRRLDAQMWADRKSTVIAGATMFVLPLASVYATWSILSWIRRRRTGLDVAIVTGVSLVALGATGAIDSDTDRFLVTLGVAIATSAVLAQRRRHAAEPLTGSSIASLDPTCTGTARGALSPGADKQRAVGRLRDLLPDMPDAVDWAKLGSVAGTRPFPAMPKLTEWSSRHPALTLTAALALVFVAITLIDSVGGIRGDYSDALAKMGPVWLLSPINPFPVLGNWLFCWILLRSSLGFWTLYKATVLAQLWFGLVGSLGFAVASLADSSVIGGFVSIPLALAGLAWAYGRFLRERDGRPLGFGFWTLYKATVLAQLWFGLVGSLGFAVASLADSFVIGGFVSIPPALAGMAWVYGRFLRERNGRPLGFGFGARLTGLQVGVALVASIHSIILLALFFFALPFLAWMYASLG